MEMGSTESNLTDVGWASLTETNGRHSVSTNDEVVKIRIGKFTVGVVGLKAALENAAQCDFSSEGAVVTHLLEQLRAKNYIPPGGESEYGKSVLREYRKCKGEPIEAEKPFGLEVKVLGPGCPNCDNLEKMVFQVMATEGISGDVEHVSDVNRIAAYGMVAVPALVINGEVKCVGRLPGERQLREWLRMAESGR
jgi:small redox-active disulfide protein 2